MSAQDKSQEIAFFSDHTRVGEYNVFTDESNRRILDAFRRLAGACDGALVCDLGCGSGAFTQVLQEAGLQAAGVDICQPLLALGRRVHPGLPLAAGDVERLPLASESLDAVLLSGLVHHLPDPSACAHEVYRVLRPGGAFLAFDPNRANPFMWLYRDRTSPLYSSKGVTPNERPVVAAAVVRVFAAAGLETRAETLSLHYRYVASSRLRWALTLYNALESALFAAGPLRRCRNFVLTYGVKPCPS